VVGTAMAPTPTEVPPTATAVPSTPTPEPIATATEVITNTVQLDLAPLLEMAESDTPIAPVEARVTVDETMTRDTHAYRTWYWISGGAGLILGLLVWRKRSRQPVPPGQVSLYDGSQYLQTVDLSSFGKPVVTLGGAGADIELENEDEPLPAVVARILAQVTNGKPQAIWEVLDPTDPTVNLERQPLYHGDQVPIIYQFRLEYSHYEVETTSFLEGEYIHV